MDLIEEYLKAVAALLPRAHRDDIVAELRDTILTRKEEREDQLGRPLTFEETEALLREIGHPLVVAARYGEGPQHVVGPMLYPYWLFGVKLVLLIQACVAGIVFLASLGYGDFGFALVHGLGTGLMGAATLIGFATAAVWLIERHNIRIGYLDTWHVKDLRAFTQAAEGLSSAFSGKNGGGGSGWPRREPPRPAPPRHDFDRDVLRPGRPHRPGPMVRGVGLMAWSAVLLVWWLGGFHILGPRGFADMRPAFDPGPLAATDWSALKAALLWPVFGFILGMMAQGAVLAALPHQVRVHGLLDILMGAALLTLVLWVWNLPALAPSVQVDSVAGFFVRMVQAFAHGPPFPIPAIITAFLVFTGFGAICRMFQGLFEALFPAGCRGRARPVVA
jgi:hypothetical protein